MIYFGQLVGIIKNEMEVLNKNQANYFHKLLSKIKNGEYLFTPNACPCGQLSDLLLENLDRYGIPLTTVICRKCGLIRSDPYFIEKSLKNFYKYEYRGLYGGTTHPNLLFFNSRKEGGRFFYDYLKAYYYHKDFTKKVIFEVGCSVGGVLEYFKERGDFVYGCDYDSSHIEFGKARGLNLINGGSVSLFSLGKKADIIILSHIVEHFRNLQEELSRIRKLLKDNGILFVAVPGVRWIHKSYDGDFKNLVQIAHCYSFTLTTLSGVLARAGFKLVSGDESVFGIFVKSKKVGEKRDDYKEVVNYIENSYRLRYYYVAKRWVYESLIAFLKKIHAHNFILDSVYNVKGSLVTVKSMFKKWKL